MGESEENEDKGGVWILCEEEEGTGDNRPERNDVEAEEDEEGTYEYVERCEQRVSITES